jgi:hypothetical protein
MNRKELKESGCGPVEVRSRDMSGETEDKPQKISFRKPNDRHILVAGISRMQFTAVTCSDRDTNFQYGKCQEGCKIFSVSHASNYVLTLRHFSRRN